MWAAINGIASLKITSSGSTSTTLPAESSVNPDGEFIHALAATTETLPRMPVITTGTPVQKCGPRLQPPPAEDVDGDEDRLGEEEQALEGERDAERLAPLAHEPRPQQPELEAQHRAGDGADGERDRHVLRPPLGQLQGVGVVVLEPAVVGDQRHDAHDTPSGTRMMWKASVNAICARAHGTGLTARSAFTAPGCSA